VEPVEPAGAKRDGDPRPHHADPAQRWLRAQLAAEVAQAGKSVA